MSFGYCSIPLVPSLEWSEWIGVVHFLASGSNGVQSASVKEADGSEDDWIRDLQLGMSVVRACSIAASVAAAPELQKRGILLHSFIRSFVLCGNFP